MLMARRVVLRDERNGRDWRILSASLEGGALVIEGHDLGPSTAPIRSDGEYEWSYRFQSSAIPVLRAALGGTEDVGILDLLARKYTGAHSYELERIMRDTDSTIPRTFWSWSG